MKVPVMVMVLVLVLVLVEVRVLVGGLGRSIGCGARGGIGRRTLAVFRRGAALGIGRRIGARAGHGRRIRMGWEPHKSTDRGSALPPQ